MPRPVRALTRLIVALLLAAVLVGAPLLLFTVVGMPLPTPAQLRAAWTARRVDADVVVRIGAFVFLLLWAWFAVTALGELWRVLAWRREGGTARLAPVPPGPSGWVRSMVRFVAVSSVGAGALLSGLAASVRPVMAVAPGAPAAVASVASVAGGAVAPVEAHHARHVAGGRDTPYSLAMRAGDPALRERIIELNTGRFGPDGREWTGGVFPSGMEVLLPGEATVLTPLGPAHEVEVGDCYWEVAEDHLAAVAPGTTARDVWEYTHDLIDLNAPRLGHDDPTLLLAGELVLLPPAPGQAEPEVRELAEPDVAATPVTTPVPQGVDSPHDVDSPPAPLPSATADAGAPSRAGTAPTIVVSEGGAVVPFLAGVGTATLMAAGALAVLEARRRERLRVAAIGARLAPPEPAVVRTEIALRSLGAAERAARLDVALRAAAPAVAAQQAVVTAAVLGDDGAVHLYLHGAAAPTDTRWRLDIGDGSWVLPAEVELADLRGEACGVAHPCPGMVQLGAVAGGELFVDLEAVGLLVVESPHAEAVLRAVAASLDLSPFVGSGRVALVEGRPGETAATLRTDVVDSLDAALEASAVAIGSTVSLARGRSTFSLRVAGAGGEAWEPALLVAPGSHPADALHALLRAARPSSGLAAAVEGPVAGATWTLRAEGGTHVLQPLGLVVTPVGLSAPAVAEVRALLVADAVPSLPPAAPVSLVRADPTVTDPAVTDPTGFAGPAVTDPTGFAGPPAFTEPEWTLLVRVFGQVEVVDTEGQAVPFERSKALELVVWLSQHRERPTRQAARTALWDVDVRDATFANVVSDARRAMARLAPPADGEEWIARTLTEDLPLHPGVRSDAELVRRRVEHARTAPPREAVEVLRPAVELLAGMPFAGTGYLWCDAEGLSSSLSLLAVEAAGALAEHCLAMGDTDGVFWATGQGLKVIGGHEALVELRMRAHARRGDFAGVRGEWESYERALAADTFLQPEPSPKLVALRRELLAPSLAG